MFFLIGEQEVPLYQMLREGLASRIEEGKEELTTNHPICKLFVSRQGFGVPRQFHSFYIKLDSSQPTLRIVPFSGEATGFYFTAKSRLMGRDEVLAVLPEKIESRFFFIRQEVLSINLMERMVHIDRSEIRGGVRSIKIRRKEEDERRYRNSNPNR